VDQAGVTEVVEAALVEDLGVGLELDDLAKLDAVAGEQLEEDTTERAEHGPVAVDDIELAVLGEGLRIGGQLGSVPCWNKPCILSIYLFVKLAIRAPCR
jgi:hypothetical protein